MKELDDGRYNKVANIIRYNEISPHGDASMVMQLYRLDKKIY